MFSPAVSFIICGIEVLIKLETSSTLYSLSVVMDMVRRNISSTKLDVYDMVSPLFLISLFMFSFTINIIPRLCAGNNLSLWILINFRLTVRITIWDGRS